jgi:hypothetical protein
MVRIISTLALLRPHPSPPPQAGEGARGQRLWLETIGFMESIVWNRPRRNGQPASVASRNDKPSARSCQRAGGGARRPLPTKIPKTTPCKVAWRSPAMRDPFENILTRRANHRQYSIIAQLSDAHAPARQRAVRRDRRQTPSQLKLHRLATAKDRLSRCRAARRSACPRR